MLAALFVIVAGLYGLLASVHTWGEAQLTPKLGLDLEGGTAADPRAQGRRQPRDQPGPDRQGRRHHPPARGRQRRGRGRGGHPGWPQHRHLAAGQAAAEHRGLPQQVLPAALPAGPRRDAERRAGPRAPAPPPSGHAVAPATATPSGKATATPSAKATTPAKATAKPSSPASTSAGSGFPEALRAPAPPRRAPRPRPGQGPRVAKATARRAHGDQRAGADPHRSGAGPDAPAADAAKGTASDLAQITPAIEKQLTSLDCTKPAQVQAIVDDPDKVMVTCSVDGTEQVHPRPGRGRGPGRQGRHLRRRAQPAGRPTGGYEIRLSFNGKGTKEFGDVTTRLVGLQPPQNQFAIVLDNLVISAPQTNAADHQRLGEHHRQLHRRERAGCWPTSSSSARCRCRSRCRRRTTSAPRSAPTSCRRACSPAPSACCWSCSTRCSSTARSAWSRSPRLVVAVGDHLRRGHAAGLVARLPADAWPVSPA